MFLAMLAATPVGWAAPAAAQETSGEYREALGNLHAEMNELTLEIENFRVSRRYCKPPGIPSKAEAQAELDALAKRAEALNQRYNALKQSLKDFAKNPRVAAELMLRDIDPTDDRWFSSYEAARRRMADALARKRAALAAVPEVDCTPKPKPQPPVTTGGFQPPALPVRPSTASPTVPTLPTHFCSQDEKNKFLRDVIHPLYNKAAEDAELVAKFRTQVEQAVNSYVQNDRPVPADLIARRRQAIADVEAANRRMRETEDLYNRAKAIPVIDCRTPQQDPPGQDMRTGQTPPETGLIRQDLGRMAQQQSLIGEIEGAIAEIDALRKAGRCNEIVELEGQLYRDIGMLGRLVFENPDGTRSKMVPPGVVEELRRKAKAAARPCPPTVKPSPETALTLPTPPPGSFAARFLNAHNTARTEFGSPPLQWDPALAVSALAHAQQMGTLGRVHSTREGRKDVRENLLQSLPGGRTIEQMVGVWLAEQRNFVPGIFPNVSRTGNWGDIGHFTQMVWPTTTRVGCAVARGGGFDWTVCHYSPPGNRDGTAIRTGNPVTMPHPRTMVAQPMPQPRGEVAGGANPPVIANRDGIAPPNSTTTTDRPDLPRPTLGGGMQQIDPPPPPPPPPPTARDDAPEGDEARHPLVTYLNEASARHATAVDCGDRAAQEAELAKMRYALDELKKRLKAAKKAGPYSAVKPADVQKQIDDMERKMKEAGERKPRPVCPPTPPAPQTRGIVTQSVQR